jgi:anthranilate synthase component 1
MSFSPAQNEFETHYSAGKPVIVSTRIPSDLETPVSAYLKLCSDETYSFLLESVEDGERRGRYTILGLRPDLLFRASGQKAEICHAPEQGTFAALEKPTLEALRDLLEASKFDLPEDMPPMSAGIFGYLGYDTVRLIERLPEPNPDTLNVDDVLLLRPTMMVIFDNIRDEVTLVSISRPNGTLNAAKAYSKACEDLNMLLDKLDQATPKAVPQNDVTLGDAIDCNMTPEEYKAAVLKAKDYISAGDIFQVVLSQRFSSKFPLPPFALYRALRRIDPAPFWFFLNFNGLAITGSSPEILVRLQHGEVTIRPIAGTRKRGETREEDLALAEELLADPKERAEHLMLLDLGRNDVGRVAKIGTVRVTDSFFIERYSAVMHIVSNVTGKIRDGLDALDALKAGFPAGTVSGAPKVRAMEIIDELEVHKRGVYGGCIGYFSANGDMDTCIALRTAVLKDGTVYVQAGAGIVADSVPENEHQECVNKARAMFRSVEEAKRYASLAKRGQ